MRLCACPPDRAGARNASLPSRDGESIFTCVNPGSSQQKQKRALRTQLRETVKSAILDAAEQRISAKGLHATSLNEIAKAAGVAVGTLYNYFTDRDALVRELLESRRANLRPQLEEVLTGHTGLPFEQRFRTITREMFEVFERHRLYLVIMFQAEHMRPASKIDFYAMFEKIFAGGAAEKVIATKHVAALVTVFTGAIKSVLVRRIADDTPFVTDADPICSLLLDGARRK